MPFFKKVGKILETIFAPKLVSGAVDEMKRPANVLSSNFKDLIQILKKRFNQTETELPSETLDGKTRFRNIMIQNRVTPEMYETRLKEMYFAHWIYLIGYILAFGWLFYLFFAAKEYVLSLFFFGVVTVIYFQYSKRATELREQEFLSLKEFLTYPSFWIPNTHRTNDYFEVNFDELNPIDVDEVLNDNDLTQEELKNFDLYKQLKADQSAEWLEFKEFMQEQHSQLTLLQIYKKYIKMKAE